MKRLVLHIGTAKTGTTAIQHFLYRNRERLNAAGYGIPVQTGVYLRPTTGSEIARVRNGHFLIPLALAKISPPEVVVSGEATARRDAKFVCNFAKRYKTIVLSDEGLSVLLSCQAPFRHALKAVLAEHGVERTEIVVYLRRQDQFISSRWRERVKSSRSLSIEFEEFIRNPAVIAYADYNTWIADLENIFGPGTVVVRRYDRSRFPDGEICRDFCEASGIPWDEGFEILEAVNPSLSLDVAEVKRIFNALPAYAYRKSGNFLKASALRASVVLPDPPGTSLFSPEEAAELLARHAEGNQAIAERHFNGEPLFNEDVSGLVKWRRDEGRLLNAAIVLFTEALAEQRVEQKNNWNLLMCVKRFAKNCLRQLCNL